MEGIYNKEPHKVVVYPTIVSFRHYTTLPKKIVRGYSKNAYRITAEIAQDILQEGITICGGTILLSGLLIY